MSEESRTERWRQQVQPRLAVVVDSSMCIALEIEDADGALHRATLSNCDDVTRAMELARVFVAASEDDWYSQRRTEMLQREPMPGSSRR